MNIKTLIRTVVIIAAMAGATTLYAATQDTVETEPKDQTVATEKTIHKDSKPAELPKDATTDANTNVNTDTIKNTSSTDSTEKSTKEATDKTAKPAKKSDRFIPTESISEDLAVSFPVDI
jgi:hypothetical protein